MLTALTVVALGSVALTLVTHASVRVLVRRRPCGAGATPKVSILKPLKGVDDDLFENLVSFARQDYPAFQIVFGAEDPDDPALAVARRVQREHPGVDIRIVAGAAPLGLNPKVRNLASLCKAASHDLWLVSDSNVRVDPDYLRQTVAVLAPDVGIVTNLFVGVGERTLGAHLENLQLCTWIAGGMAASQVLARRACVVGKSMLFQRQLLARIGGWHALRDILAEDYVMGTMVERLGLRTVLAPHVIRTVNGSWSFARFLNRHQRWAQIRRRVCPAAYALEPLLYPTPWLCLLACAGAPLAALLGLGIKVASDLTLARRLRGTGFGPAAPAAILGKDLLLAGVWFVGAFRRRVSWRGNRLWIGAGTVLSDVPEARHAHAEPEVAARLSSAAS